MLHSFRGFKRTLRVKLIESYPRTLESFSQEASSDFSMEAFANGMKQFLMEANKPYAERNAKGIYYASDYVSLYAPSEQWRPIKGLTHPKYWNIKHNNGLYVSKEDRKPSDCLHAFFKGPTFADCGNVIQAIIYRSIQSIIGSEQFNSLFGRSVTPFTISQNLFSSMQKAISHYADKTSEESMRFGNPLYFLFDKVETDNVLLKENDIKKGDVVYIEGVENYRFKHLAGFALGWNVICVGKNPTGENLYLGFGPNEFQKPLTFLEIKKILVSRYNEPQSKDTLDIIQQLKNKGDLSSMEEAQKSLAMVLANDIVTVDQALVGIKYAIRFNVEKFRCFVNQKPSAWHSEKICESLFSKEGLNSAEKTIPAENKEKTFSDFKAETPQQQEMLTLSKKFVQSVVTGDKISRALVFSGQPGIGKTQLSVNIAKFAEQHGKKVLFMSAESLRNEYQRLCEESGGKFYSESKLIKHYESMLKGQDLIVLDDINSNYGKDSQFLTLAIKHVFSTNASIVMSSNSSIDYFKEKIPGYIGYDNPLNDNFVICQGLSGESARKRWWSELADKKDSLPEYTSKLQILAAYCKTDGAGIVLEGKDIDLQGVLLEFKKLCPSAKVRVADAPYKNNKIYDFYFHDRKKYDTFIIKVTECSEAKQLLNLINAVHDQGAKLIIVTDSYENLRKQLSKALELNGIISNTNPRLQDRLNRLIAFDELDGYIFQRAQKRQKIA